MAMIELDLSPDRARLRQFGWIGLVGFALLAGLAWTEQAIFAGGLGAARVPLVQAFAALGAWAGLAGLLYPPANRPLWVVLVLVSFPIGLVLSYVMLGLLFFGVITPAGLLLRLSRRDPLERRRDAALGSYWVESRGERDKDAYFKQF